MKPVKSNLFNMIVAMAVVAIGSAAAIGYVYQKTAEPIAAARNLKTINAIKEVISDFDNDPFSEKTHTYNDEVELYPARQDDVITSVAIKSADNEGFGGKIELIIGIAMDGTITGYKVVEHNETPGLGSKISEKKFNSQFIGLNAYSDKFKLTKDGGEIDAVTGATISSRAVTRAVRKAVSAYKKFTGAAGHE